MYKYDYIIFIGRFQPFHLGHAKIVDRALELSEKVIIVLGSHNQPRTFKNPWTSNERKEMILAHYAGKRSPARFDFIYQEDYMYSDDKWIASIQGQVQHIIHKVWKPGPIRIGLIGHNKDHSSFYLNLFPQWSFETVDAEKDFNATDLRTVIFAEESHTFNGYWDPERLGVGVSNYISEWWKNNLDAHAWVRNEKQHLDMYTQQWANSPYPPTFVTVDAVVVQSGHVLMVKRGAMPGKGQLALPGGFINQHEKLKDAMLRELREETKIKVPEPVLRGSIVDSRVYDNPMRSQRGRTITHAFFLHLKDQPALPQVKGSDDAEKAMWYPLGQLNRSEIFEDHYDIIDDLVNL